MTQYLRPLTEISESNWTGAPSDINEVTPDDGDYYEGLNSANGTFEVLLDSGTDPESSSDHVVKYRVWDEGNSFSRGIEVYLMEDTSVIASWTDTELDHSAEQKEHTLTSGQADSITDYTDLRLRFTSTGDVGTPAPNRSTLWVSWAVLEIPDAAGGTDELTGGDLTGSAPVLDNPTMKQTEIIASGDLLANAPVLDSPVMKQIENLLGSDLTSNAPILDNPTIAQIENISGGDLLTGAPVLDTPTIQQVENLLGGDLVGSNPVLDSPTISQIENLLAASLNASAPVLGNPIVGTGAIEELSGGDLLASAPILDNPTIKQIEVLLGNDLTASAPILDNPTISQIENLLGNDLTASAPILDSPTIKQLENLLGADLTASAPILGNPTLQIIGGDILTGGDLTAAAPILGNPTLMIVSTIPANKTLLIQHESRNYDIISDVRELRIPYEKRYILVNKGD